ncbi:glycoside hydrolase family 2 protein [Caenimonas soli]|uniref:glycoside hydrolase family 2 protein n=1 Tax=Caenimonas soli TaxID=2735555 RepID=UPI00155678A4|nr:glycoside hydrolase family 2 protein [Caenimonas soli]NPC57363.1 glycoside hydrolase family 2 protein [Caenimonas soli]
MSSNWQMCACAPGNDTRSAPPEGCEWLSIDELAPAAAALRALEQWSLKGPARRFDAQEWWYRLEFDAQGLKQGDRAILGFDGLATVAQVWLNGETLLGSTNMFLAHECDVSRQLREKDNSLVMRFSALDSQLEVRRKRPRWRTPMVAHQQLRWFRTTLLGRTSGWSPPAAVVGPWKPVWLEQSSDARIQDLHVEASVEGGQGIVNCRLEFAPGAGRLPQAIALRLERGGCVAVQRLDRAGDAAVFSGQLHIGDVDLWWPHTHGEPALYEARLEIRMADAPDAVVRLAPVGFRTIELDSTGGGFSLSVNGVPVFCRGACWTPLDAVTLRSSPDSCRAAVAQARAAGMNMLRVPGTTVYEEDHFYEACDEHGVMVWQDFMFASMDYPADDPAFAASVALEVRQQLQRLRSRACLAVLCGNSEVEQQAAMWGAPREQWSCALFDETLPQLCRKLAPGVPYWPSSAHGGAFPHQASTGTTSYYGVGAYLRPLDDARRAELKFATECLAFANVPAPSAIGRMPGGHATRAHHAAWKERSPRDLGAGWDFDDVRDHYVSELFRVNPAKLRAMDHDRYLALGRLATGEVMGASFAEWRRPGSTCRGALVLCLRDLWAGAGWGVVDDAGVPKACYHYLKRVLQPLAVLLSDEGVNGLFAHLVNENGEEVKVELELTAWRDGTVRVASGTKAMALPARGSLSLSCLDLLDHFMDLNYAYRFGPPPCDAIVATLRDARGEVLARAFHFPDGLATKAQADIGLSAQAVMLDERTAELTVHSVQFAQGVHIDIPGFLADDDYFHLPPDTPVRVLLRRQGDHPLAGFVHATNSIKSASL